jgi:hypothetical protein
VRLLAGGLLLAVRGHGRAVVGVGLRRRAAPTHRQVLAPPHPQRHALLLCSCWHGMAGMEACMARWHGGMAWIGLWALWWMALLCLGPCLLLVPTLARDPYSCSGLAVHRYMLSYVSRLPNLACGAAQQGSSEPSSQRRRWQSGSPMSSRAVSIPHLCARPRAYSGLATRPCSVPPSSAHRAPMLSLSSPSLHPQLTHPPLLQESVYGLLPEPLVHIPKV